MDELEDFETYNGATDYDMYVDNDYFISTGERLC